ncbi:MAG: group 1 truncated hemoglobin [Bacteroidia bacterium]|nr:group 1 truncated hemoglobin [Bacteroidia bacterium]
MKKTSLILAVLATGIIITTFSCKKKTETIVEEKIVYQTPPPGPPTLYTRLGGINPITLVVDKFINNCATNSFIGSRFSSTAADPNRLQVFRYNLIDQVCEGSGGPCKYKGKTMLQAHTGMNITGAEFDTLVVQLVKAMNTYSVPTQEQNDLAAILLPMKTDIVGH